MNLYKTIVEENAFWSGTAVIDRERTVSYPELFRGVETAANRLRKAGIGKDARVALIGDDSFEYILLSLAVLSLSAAILPFSSRSPRREIRAMIRETKANFSLCTASYKFENAIPLFPNGAFFRDPWFLSREDPELHPINFEDGETPAFIRFSSGTTGRNKGVILSHRTVLERTDACRALEVRRGEHILWVLDMAYHFVVTILLFLRKGAVIVICPKPVESHLAEMLRNYPIQLLYATPYHYRLMIRSAEIRKKDLPHIQGAFSTAMKLEHADAVAFREKFGFPLTQAYGIIEVGLPCVNRSDDPEKADSVGRLQMAYQLKINSPDPSGAGGILLKGPGFFDAYLSPFRLRKEICPDGYFNTGDIGCLDRDGYLFILGRSKNIINFAGMKIFPAEVESVLNAFPGIRESLVRPKKMEGFGEIPVADLVTETPSALTGEWKRALREFCYERLASHKVPKEFNLVPELPKTYSGKIIRASDHTTPAANPNGKHSAGFANTAKRI